MGTGEPYIEPLWGDHIFVHIRLFKPWPGDATCQVYVTEMRKVGIQEPIFKQRKLRLTVQNAPDTTATQTIDENDWLYFDLIKIPNTAKNEFVITGSQADALKLPPFGPGAYDFGISSRGTNCRNDETIHIEYDNNSRLVLSKR